MKILHLGKYYPPFHGGMEHYLQDLAEAQVKQGHQVTVLVHNHQHGMVKAPTHIEHINGVQVIRQKSTRPVLFTPLMLGFNRTLKRLVHEQQIDLLHLHWPNPTLALLLFNKKIKKIPWLIRWHADMVTESSSGILKFIYRLIRPIEQALINQSDCILISSPSYIPHSTALQKNRSKCQVLPLGISPLVKNPKTLPIKWANDQWPEDKLKVFNLGRLTYYKNQKLLIKAARKGVHHTLIAGDGHLHSELQSQINHSQLTNVQLMGSLGWQEVNALYQSCDVFCLPSDDRAESFGVVLLEAMWHNKIILVADTHGSGMTWLAQQYNKGFVFKSNDTQDLLAQLDHIQNHMDEIKQRPKDFKWPIEQTTLLLNNHYQSIKKETS